MAEFNSAVKSGASKESTLLLVKRGAGMHHLCLEVDDIAATMKRLTDHGIALINDMPKMNEDGTRYCFVHPKSANGVMVELYELSATAKAAQNKTV